MLRKKKVIFLFVAVSISIHLTVLFLFFIKVDKKSANPVLCSWLNTIIERNLYHNKNKVVLQPFLLSSSENIKEKCFAFPVIIPLISSNEGVYPLSYSKDVRREYCKVLFLWQRHAPVLPEIGEKIPYKVYVASSGEAIFSFPNRLPFDTRRGISFQQYIKDASLFLDNKIFWTRVDKMVK